MIKAIISDFSRVILFPANDSYESGLNALHKELSQKPQYIMLDHFKINTDLLDFYISLKEKVSLYMFTSETIQEAPEFQPYLQPVFEKIFSAIKMGVSKQESESYKQLAEEIGVNEEEILFIDDSENNITIAKSVGMKTIQYVDNEQTKKDITTLLF